MGKDMEIRAKFLSKIKIEGECWLWTGALTDDGYGLVNINGVNKRAHRVVFEEQVRKLSSKELLSATCSNRNCVNPAHMEILSPENLRHRNQAARNAALSQLCPKGHKLDEKRKCRICTNDYMRDYMSRRRKEANRVGAETKRAV
jgi:hypothetical protein